MSDQNQTGWSGGEIAPKPEVLADLVARHRGPVVMLNVLKFKPDAGDGRTGVEAYAAYGAAATEMSANLRAQFFGVERGRADYAESAGVRHRGDQLKRRDSAHPASKIGYLIPK